MELISEACNGKHDSHKSHFPQKCRHRKGRQQYPTFQLTRGRYRCFQTFSVFRMRIYVDKTCLNLCKQKNRNSGLIRSATRYSTESKYCYEYSLLFENFTTTSYSVHVNYQTQSMQSTKARLHLSIYPMAKDIPGDHGESLLINQHITVIIDICTPYRLSVPVLESRILKNPQIYKRITIFFLMLLLHANSVIWICR